MPSQPSTTPVALVLAFHGLGEHIRRYDHMFDRMAAAGILVKGMDYRGHGRTLQRDARRGGPAGFHQSLEAVFADAMVLRALPVDGLDPGIHEVLPTFVFGHSLGGLLAVTFCDEKIKERIPTFKGVIAQAPALQARSPVHPFVKWLANLLGGSFLGRTGVPNGLDVSRLCSDDTVVKAYLADPLVHPYASLRLGRDIFAFGDRAMAAAADFRHPVLVCVARDDRMISFVAAEEFVSRCSSVDKTFRAFDESVYHELHNEPSVRDEIEGLYVEWILARLS
ncbi:hypothetical protein HK405_009320 [Cladochytrium tenue]|nr:hypothetical protein HK405_009320 [Cladochytrium tenue]